MNVNDLCDTISQCVVAGCHGFHWTLKRTATHTHRVRYHLAPKYTCDQCQKTFPEKSSLEKHQGSHRHAGCKMCCVTLNPHNMRRHIKTCHANIVKGRFTVKLCLSCLEVGCDGDCQRRESRRSKNEILRISFEHAEQYLGIELTDKKAGIVESDSETPKMIVIGKFRNLCDKLDKLKAFEKAVDKATSYEYV